MQFLCPVNKKQKYNFLSVRVTNKFLVIFVRKNSCIMLENLNNEEKAIEQKEKVVKKEFKEFWEVAIDFIKELFNIRKNTDKDFTRQTILENIPFRGHTAWLLIFSIMVASVGLNANSTPVVIGAMLISPLMGPIMGAGFSIGTNDIETFRKSAINFLVMVTLSIITSFIYFKISPFDTASSELLARKSPTFFDVMIAFFGGLAGIVALTKKGFFNVISGVAIATALMPPLCTAGFGLATSQYDFFTGAMYLLLINSFYISLATFIVIKYLRFPVARYLNSAKRRRISRFIYVLAFLVMIPSILSFVDMYNQEVFKRTANDFIKKEIKYEGTQVIKTNIDPFKKNIDLYLIGEMVPEPVIKAWQSKLKDYDLKEVKMNVYQSADKSSEIEQNISEKVKEQILEKLFKENKQLLESKKEQINRLTQEVNKLQQKLKKEQIPFAQISKEMKMIFPAIKEVSFGKTLYTDFKKTDTLPVFMIRWNHRLPYRTKRKEINKLQKWLKSRAQLDTLKIISLN